MAKEKHYAIVNPPFKGKHLRPQDAASLKKRKKRWQMRGAGMTIEEVNRELGRGR